MDKLTGLTDKQGFFPHWNVSGQFYGLDPCQKGKAAHDHLQ